jgi:hypothetical protein
LAQFVGEIDDKSAQMLEEEVDTLRGTALDFCVAFRGGGECAAVAALVHLDAIDIDATAGQFAAEFDRKRGQCAFERGTAALCALPGVGGRCARGLDLAGEYSLSRIFAERNCRCT